MFLFLLSIMLGFASLCFFNNYYPQITISFTNERISVILILIAIVLTATFFLLYVILFVPMIKLFFIHEEMSFIFNQGNILYKSLFYCWFFFVLPISILLLMLLSVIFPSVNFLFKLLICFLNVSFFYCTWKFLVNRKIKRSFLVASIVWLYNV